MRCPLRGRTKVAYGMLPLAIACRCPLGGQLAPVPREAQQPRSEPAGLCRAVPCQHLLSFPSPACWRQRLPGHGRLEPGRGVPSPCPGRQDEGVPRGFVLLTPRRAARWPRRVCMSLAWQYPPLLTPRQAGRGRCGGRGCPAGGGWAGLGLGGDRETGGEKKTLKPPSPPARPPELLCGHARCAGPVRAPRRS